MPDTSLSVIMIHDERGPWNCKCIEQIAKCTTGGRDTQRGRTRLAFPVAEMRIGPDFWAVCFISPWCGLVQGDPSGWLKSPVDLAPAAGWPLLNTVFHPLVVEVSCVLFLDYACWLGQKKHKSSTTSIWNTVCLPVLSILLQQKANHSKMAEAAYIHISWIKSLILFLNCELLSSDWM